MSTTTYAVSVLAPQPPLLAANETGLKITESTSNNNLHVAASVKTSAGSDGNPVVVASVRVIKSDGAPALDANGNPCSTVYGISVTPEILSASGSIQAVQKGVLLVALGLPSPTLAVDAATAQNASIIERALAALALQPVSVATLLA